MGYIIATTCFPARMEALFLELECPARIVNSGQESEDYGMIKNEQNFCSKIRVL